MDSFLGKPVVVADLAALLEDLALARGDDAAPMPVRDDVIDLRVLDRLSGEIGRGTVLELVAMFRDDVERSAPGLQRAAEVVDRAEVSSLAHRLRSAARTLGAEHLAALGASIAEREA